MTRAEIRKKYGIVRLEHPDIANRILTDEEAKDYENFVAQLKGNFDTYWDDDDSGDVD